MLEMILTFYNTSLKRYIFVQEASNSDLVELEN